MYKVAFVTGSRADYGIVRKYLSLLQHDEEIQFSLLLTGAATDNRYGSIKELIGQDGFRIDKEVRAPLANTCVSDTLHTMAIILDDCGKYFESHKYDLLIILGDRYEIFSVAIAAAMQHIRILHIHGGEITYANYDEFIRHSITKMSWYHITSTEVYRDRVIQMGERPENVYNCGALGAENCRLIHMENVPLEIQSFAEHSYFVVLFHPETMNPISPLDQVEEVIEGIRRAHLHCDYFFIGSNADTGAGSIDTAIRDFSQKSSHMHYCANLHPDAYHYLVKHAIALVGNSSSGIIEAPSLNTLTINIGARQKGRVRGKSVIDIPCRRKIIEETLEQALRGDFQNVSFSNPYERKNCADLYYQVTVQILHRKKENFAKIFYDIDRSV